MRVLHVHNAFVRPLGGAEMYVLGLVRSLRERGHDIELATLEADADVVGDLPTVGLRARNVYRPASDVPRPAVAKATWHVIDTFNPTALPSIVAAARRFRPDIVHTHNFQGLSGALFLAARSYRHVHSVHDYALVDTSTLVPTSKSPLSMRVRNAVLRKLLRPNVVLFTGPESKTVHERLGVPGRGVRSVAMPSGWPSPIATPPQPRNPSGPVKFLLIGRLEEAKGVRFLLDTWRAASPPGAELWIAGAGTLAPAVAAAAESNAAVRYVGWADAKMKSELFMECDVLLHPSDSEVNSIVQMEAFLGGLAVVSTPDAASSFAKDGYNARIVPRDESVWCRVITCLTDRAVLTSLQTGARETAPRLDWRAHIRDIEDVYESLMQPMRR